MRTRVGLQRYSEDEMIAKLAAAGFTASRARANIGHNPWRMTFVARHALFDELAPSSSAVRPLRLNAVNVAHPPVIGDDRHGPVAESVYAGAVHRSLSWFKSRPGLHASP